MAKKAPAILQHPNIPKPLHGMAPRSIKGTKWWDIQRKKAYALNDYHCWACGIHKTKAKYRKHLEAHEYYEISYTKHSMQLKYIVALCHSCHNFIHSGRLLAMYQKGEISKSKAMDILNHGVSVLKQVNLRPSYHTRYTYLRIKENMSNQDALATLFAEGYPITDENNAEDWKKWHIIIEGKKYYSKYENEKEWGQVYA